AHPRAVDMLSKLPQRGTRQVGINGDVMPLRENTAQFEEIRIDAWLSTRHMEQPHLSRRVERRPPLSRRGKCAQLLTECDSRGKTVVATVVASIQQMPISFELISHLMSPSLPFRFARRSGAKI